MTLTLALTLMLIGFLDSLNPSLFIGLFYLLTTPRPAWRILAYIAGILVVMYGGGVLLLSGASAASAGVSAAVGADALNSIQLVVGLLLLIFGVWMRVHNAELNMDEARKPRSLAPWSAFLLGIVFMAQEITTALPYFVAIERMTSAHLTTVESALGLLLYNAVFSLPLFAFLVLGLRLRERFTRQIEAINAFLGYWMPRLIKYGTLALGVWLSVSAASALFVR